MSVFALVDCNNFYASCERVFNPKLENQPIVILSNNDGCVIARSNEAKNLNVPMGAPYFQHKDFFQKNKIKVFSSNYELYGDLSTRVMSILESMCPEIEIYSIDEAFLQLDSFKNYNLVNYCMEIRKKVKRWVGIPVSVGIAPTKTLAKIANYIAKKQTSEGIFDLTDISIQDKILSDFSVGNIWGVGKQISNKLIRMGIHTAKDLREAHPKDMRQRFSVVMEKMIEELRGHACLQLEEMQPKKQIMSSRSFGKKINKKTELSEAVAYHVTNACEQLRKQNSRASGIYFFLHTSPFSNKPHYANSMSFKFPEHTNDTSLMIKCAIACLNKLFRAGYEYHKLGIMLLDLVPVTIHQQDLFLQHKQRAGEKQEILMKTLDKINLKLGKGTLKYCTEGNEYNWSLRSSFRSNRFTTCETELVKVFCK